jgi:hypothetical protein
LPLPTGATQEATQLLIKALLDKKTLNGTTIPIAKTSSVTVADMAAANPNRKNLVIYNDSTATLYLAWGATNATLSLYSIQLAPDESAVIDFTNEKVTGLWDAANGFAMVSETVF